MLKKHHTLRYIIARTKQYLYQKRHPNAPWLTSQSVFLLNELIKKSEVGFEFGSGRSTKWLATRCKYLYSVEHSKTWYDIVSAQIKSQTNVEYFHKEVNITNPDESAYLFKIKLLENNSLDFVLNDGKIRGEVALASFDNLKSGGLYIIDNAERYIVNNLNISESIGSELSKMTVKWLDFYRKTGDWRRIWTTDGVSSTLILFKP